MKRTARRLLVCPLAAALLLMAVVAVHRLATQARTTAAEISPAALDRLVTGGAAVAALACVAWLAGAAALAVLATLPGRLGAVADGVAVRVTPHLIRRAAGALTGVAVLAGPAAPAFAATDTTVRTTASAPAVSSTVGAVTHLAALPPPDRPAATPQVPRARAITARTPLRAVERQQHAEVVVLRGDTLWAISARHLGAGATTAQIAADWPRWWHANRDRIGPDPSLLLPGQILRTP